MIEVSTAPMPTASTPTAWPWATESYNGSGAPSGGDPEADDRFNPEYQFDITQAYIDVNVPMGNGLIIRTGKFVSLMGYETIDPRGNPFYSHSYLFSAPTSVVGDV